MKSAIFGSLVLLLGCMAPTYSDTFAIDYSYRDSIEDKEFILSFTNTRTRNVCLSPANWPNSTGKIDQASDIAWVDISGKRFSIVDFNTGYCPDCALKIAPGKTITARIPYADFSIPDDLGSAKKSLVFKSVGSLCK